MSQKKIAIILINYKTYAQRFLTESYESLLKLNYPKENYRIYIVDNETSEETQKMLKDMAPEAVIVPNKENSGWGGGNNAGIKQAIADGYDDYFAIVNMDTIFDQRFLEESLRVAESDPKIGIVQSKLLLHPPKNGEYLLNSKGNQITFIGFGYCGGDGEKDDVKDKVFDIVTAAGAGILVKKEVFTQAGWCDPDYFMYHDDIELSFKVKLMGYRLVLAPRSVIYHKHEFGRSIRQIYYMERNRFRFLLEFYKVKTLILIFPAFLIMEIGMLPYEIINRWLIIKLKVYIYFFRYKNIKQIIKKRKQVQKLRTIPDRELLRNAVGVVQYQHVDNVLLRYIANPVFKAYWTAAYKLLRW